MPVLDFLEIADATGGQNATDPPRSIPDNQVVAAVNVDWYDGTLGRKRGGSTAISLTGASLSGSVRWGFRYLPSADETAAEVWFADADTSHLARYSGGAWSSVAVADTWADTDTLHGASLNGKMFVAGNTAQDRLHCWDGTSFRRVGLKAPTAAPTSSLAAGTLTGNYKFKSRVTVQAAGVTIRRSEASAATAVISPVAQDITLTLAGAPGEGETHWEVYYATSADSYAVYTRIGTITIGSTTGAISTTTIAAGSIVEDVAGTYTVPWSAKYVLSDQSRLLFAGSFEQAALASRVGFSGVIGATDIGDEERYPNTTNQRNYIDLDRGDGGGITGLAGPINGCPYVFKLGQIYKLVRTGVVTSPYVPITISKSVGCIRLQTICQGDDESGNPALYFLSREGPYRLGNRGLQFLGRDVIDLFSTINLAVSVHHGVYYPKLRQVWWWIATGANTTPNLKLIFDVTSGVLTAEGVRQGWSQGAGAQAAAHASFMWPSTLGATQTLELRPYVGVGAAVWQCDTTATTDAGTAFQGYILTKPYAVASVGRKYGVDEMHLLAEAMAGAQISVTVIRDFGLESRTFLVSLQPDIAETRVIRKFESVAMAGATTLQFQIGDAAAAATGSWVLDALAVRFTLENAPR